MKRKIESKDGAVVEVKRKSIFAPLPYTSYNMLSLIFYHLVKFLTIPQIIKVVRSDRNTANDGYSLLLTVMNQKKMTRFQIVSSIAKHLDWNWETAMDVLEIFHDCREYNDLIVLMNYVSFSVEHVYGLFVSELDYRIRIDILTSKNVSVNFIRAEFKNIDRYARVFLNMNIDNKSILNKDRFMTDEAFDIMKDDMPHVFLMKSLNTNQMRYVLENMCNYSRHTSDGMLKIPDRIVKTAFPQYQNVKHCIDMYFNYYCTDLEFAIENKNKYSFMGLNKLLPLKLARQQHGAQSHVHIRFFNHELYPLYCSKNIELPSTPQFTLYKLFTLVKVDLFDMTNEDMVEFLKNPKFQARIASGEFNNLVFDPSLFNNAINYISLKNHNARHWCQINLLSNLILLILKSQVLGASEQLLCYLQKKLVNREYIARDQEVIDYVAKEYPVLENMPPLVKLAMIDMGDEYLQLCFPYMNRGMLDCGNRRHFNLIEAAKACPRTSQPFIKHVIAEREESEVVDYVRHLRENDIMRLYPSFVYRLWNKFPVSPLWESIEFLYFNGDDLDFKVIHGVTKRNYGDPTRYIYVVELLYTYSQIEFMFFDINHLPRRYFSFMGRFEYTMEMVKVFVSSNVFFYDERTNTVRINWDHCPDLLIEPAVLYRFMTIVKIDIKDCVRMIKKENKYLTVAYVTYSFDTFFHNFYTATHLNSNFGPYDTTQLKTLVEIFNFVQGRPIIMNNRDYKRLKEEIGWNLPIPLSGVNRRLLTFVQKHNPKCAEDVRSIDFSTFNMENTSEDDFYKYKTQLTANKEWNGIDMENINDLTCSTEELMFRRE